VHPRPDERHIRYSDVYEIAPLVKTEFNIEGYPAKDFMDLVKKIKPTQVTLVPDPPDALTSNAGWDTVKNLDFLTDIVKELHISGIRSSIFIETNPVLFEYAAKCGTKRVELYTEPYAANYSFNREKAIHPFVNAAKIAINLGLEVNAGHDLSLENLRYFNEKIPGLSEVSIGHALISDALYFGLENTIQMYLKQLK
jgi:pyridoxine 5-phosphate synthase